MIWWRHPSRMRLRVFVARHSCDWGYTPLASGVWLGARSVGACPAIDAHGHPALRVWCPDETIRPTVEPGRSNNSLALAPKCEVGLTPPFAQVGIEE